MKASYEEDFFERDYPQITEEKLTYIESADTETTLSEP